MFSTIRPSTASWAARRIALCSAAVLAVGAQDAVAAQTTYCVNTGPGCTGFAVPGVVDLSTILSLTLPGDTIVLGAGTYAPFAITSQDLTIVPEFFGGTFQVDATLSSMSVSSGRGVEIVGPSSTGAFIDGMEVFNGNAANRGGGIYIEDSDPVLSRARVRNNAAAAPGGTTGGMGGGIAIVGETAAGGSPTIQNSEVFDNDAEYGAGISIEDSAPLVAATSIYQNGTDPAAAGFHGGGVWSNNAGPRFLNCDIYENFASQRGGGALVQADGDGTVMRTVEFVGSYVHHNSTDASLGGGNAGGGIYAAGGFAESAAFPLELVIDTTEIEANGSWDGGGLFTTDAVVLSIGYARIDGNTAVGDGGGAYIELASGDTITNSQIAFNETGERGGGLFLDGNTETGTVPQQTLINCLLFQNGARDGAGIWAACDLQVLTSTLAENVASSSGGGLFLSGPGGAGSLLDSSIFYDNTAGLATDYGKEIVNSGASLTTRYLDWDNGTAPPLSIPPCSGPGCFNGNPGFASGPGVPPWQTVTSAYLDQAASPCVDAGNPAIPLSAPPYVTATTDPTHTPDTGIADVGYHYNGAPLPPPSSFLTQSANQLSVANGGTIMFTMQSPVSAGPSAWVFGGSSTETYPGFFYGGIVVPLIFDGYSQAVLNGGVLPNNGQLTGGMGTTMLTVAPGALSPALVGTVLYHAFFVIDPTVVRDASNPLPLTLV